MMRRLNPYMIQGLKRKARAGTHGISVLDGNVYMRVYEGHNQLEPPVPFMYMYEQAKIDFRQRESVRLTETDASQTEGLDP